MKFCDIPVPKTKSGKNGETLIFFENPPKRPRREANAKTAKTPLCSGQPDCDKIRINCAPDSRLNTDDSVEKIIINLPEITEEFDVPEYVTFDKVRFNEKKIESELVYKYLTSPICDENGCYINDHDYLGLPITCRQAKKTDYRFPDHNYSINENPACLYADLRHFCNICSRNYHNLFNFNVHMMAHTVNNHVTCAICSQKFLTTTCLNSHISLHTTICDVCGNEVPSVQIRAHQESNKAQRRACERQKIKNADKVHFCVGCMKQYASRCDFLIHHC